MENSEENKKKVEEASKLIDEMYEKGIKNFPTGALKVLGILGGESVETILGQFVNGALEHMPPGVEKDIYFWMGLKKGIEYVMAAVIQGGTFEKMSLGDKAYIACGLESVDVKINALKS